MENEPFMGVFDFKNIEPNRKYKVVIEKDFSVKEGYEYYDPDIYDPKKGVKYCEFTYRFDQRKGSENPKIISDKVDGEYFEERRKMINHFKKHYALSYSVQRDGFYDKL